MTTTYRIRNRRYPFTYDQTVYDKKVDRFTETVGPCTKANGHCLHSHYSGYSATSMFRRQWVGDKDHCCMCDAKAEFGEYKE